ncbi:MAG: FAD-binding molybdopterin dehydrogenase [Chthonomonadaceae bacterium]|nr:FAD-binding molybdopterin dehydrogenase [Chthonomonadaceae bacterium]
MEIFDYTRVQNAAQAIAAGAKSQTAQQGANVRFIAGGTTLFDLMKLNVERPETVVDINHLPLNKIEQTPNGFMIGALVRNSDLAHHPEIVKHYPVLSEALLSGASAQLRNRATTGGNLLQRTRCVYFRDTNTPCNKREPGSGCSAIDGFNRNLAILGTSEHCIATNPSDMNVALMALDAVVHIKGVKGDRTVPIASFFLLPGKTPHVETVLQPGDLVTHVSLPALPEGARSVYLKLRDRASYEFALSSAAVVAHVRDGKFDSIGIALGGVGTMPWRAKAAEALLQGTAVDPSRFRSAAEAVLKEAKPQSQNGFKVELAARCLTQALKLATRSAS